MLVLQLFSCVSTFVPMIKLTLMKYKYYLRDTKSPRNLELYPISSLSPGYFLWFPHSLQAIFSGVLTLSRLLSPVSSLSLCYFLWFLHFLYATFSGFFIFSRLLSLVFSLSPGYFLLFSHSLQASFHWFPHSL